MTRYLTVRHRVRDFDEWKRSFDENHNSVCGKYGVKGGSISRDIADPNEVTVTLEIESVERAKEMLASEELREAMGKSGVIGEPTIFFTEKAAEVPEPVSIGRSRKERR